MTFEPFNPVITSIMEPDLDVMIGTGTVYLTVSSKTGDKSQRHIDRQ
nr:MAG TPA: hypothetical protein [Caudoviricetes sp.]